MSIITIQVIYFFILHRLFAYIHGLHLMSIITIQLIYIFYLFYTGFLLTSMVWAAVLSCQHQLHSTTL